MHLSEWVVIALLLLMGLLAYRPRWRALHNAGDDAGTAYAFNRTRQTFLANRLRIANTHMTRLRGLMLASSASFTSGAGLWIVPCRGVHTLAMRFPIDVVYLDDHTRVVHVEENIRPWRVTALRFEAATVLELPVHTVYNTGTSIGDTLEIAYPATNEREHVRDAAQPAC